jgi:hypothetical protein
VTISSFKCEYCGLDNTGSYGSGRFCCKECARGFATHVKRIEINEKVSAKLKGTGFSQEKSCLNCRKEFIVCSSRRNKKFCSKKCSSSFTMTSTAGRENARKAGKASAASQSLSRRSKNEILFAELCASKFCNVKCNCAMFDGWDADIVIEDLRIAIHWNGPWHYRKITKKHSVAQVQNRDKIKYVNIEKHGYNNYIIKDEGGYNQNFVIEEFQKLLKFFKL